MVAGATISWWSFSFVNLRNMVLCFERFSRNNLLWKGGNFHWCTYQPKVSNGHDLTWAKKSLRSWRLSSKIKWKEPMSFLFLRARGFLVKNLHSCTRGKSYFCPVSFSLELLQKSFKTGEAKQTRNNKKKLEPVWFNEKGKEKHGHNNCNSFIYLNRIFPLF